MYDDKAFFAQWHRLLINFIVNYRPEGITQPFALLVHLVGDMRAGVMLLTLLNWRKSAKHPGGWIYKSWRDWNDDARITPAMLRRVTECGFLEAIGILRVVKKANGAPTNHYLLTVDAFLGAIAKAFGLTVQEVLFYMDADAVLRGGRSKRGKKRSSSNSENSDSQFAGYEWSDFNDNRPLDDSEYPPPPVS